METTESSTKKIGIFNANIIDGTKQPAYRGHLLVEGERIAKIYPLEETSKLEQLELNQRIDGSDYVLTPGFIDTHSHSDLEIITKDILEPKIRQGVTTEILGQDGVSMAPLPIEHIKYWRNNIAGLCGDSDDIDWSYKTIEGYLKIISSTTTTSNYAYLIPHGNLRMNVVGLENSQPTIEQLEQMKEIVHEAMQQGCLGLSTGLIYIPCTYAGEHELIELCKVVADYDGVFVVHQRSEANSILESMDEIIRIGLATGVKVHFSHFKICGKKNWNKLDQVIEKLDEASRKGLSVSFDMYPYIAGSTMLGVIVPPWAHEGGTDKLIMRLKDRKTRNKIIKSIKAVDSDWDNFVEFAGTNGIYITNVKSEKNKMLIGKSLNELGEIRGQDPLEAALDLLVEEENHVTMVNFYGSNEHLKTFICREEMNLCTDGILVGNPHPRAYGSYPKFISDYVEKLDLISIEEAIYKMTYKAAKLFGLIDRGIIKEGAYADLLLFDQHQFKHLGTYLNPRQFPEGLSMVMVNGQIIYNDSYNRTSCGNLLKLKR
ncbi:N-acyl-D-amino-acid deacylase family protein [Desulfuribacillus alkaliarsenatis]|uniref:D-aminoacylase n=1 Tax=Desulfuribacillus alkaliarsenatis TaxID=766136 RepID=A0A1E5G5A9_9FIRM|nr:D-aminoacylase [Desulfuribacillus alkaliarsenatis]OEF98372.1 D-aminoacylase [Desulfuribacillus alkaliarsenatis]